MPKKISIDPRDKPGLLIATMRELVGAGEISFEGSLGETGLDQLPGASFEETASLRRASLGHEMDFLVLPLTDDNVSSIWKVITESEGIAYPSNIVHVQIAVGGRFIFGGYDNFDRNCVVAVEGFPLVLLDNLVANGVIRSYHMAPDEEPIIVGGRPVAT